MIDGEWWWWWLMIGDEWFWPMMNGDHEWWTIMMKGDRWIMKGDWWIMMMTVNDEWWWWRMIHTNEGSLENDLNWIETVAKPVKGVWKAIGIGSKPFANQFRRLGNRLEVDRNHLQTSSSWFPNSLNWIGNGFRSSSSGFPNPLNWFGNGFDPIPVGFQIPWTGLAMVSIQFQSFSTFP